jgi:hypothetical protein
MLKKTIRYTDFDGNDVQEDFYFNLTKAELVELEAGTKGGLAETLKAIVAEDDNAKIIEYFKKIIMMSYGVRSDDGKRFIKTQQLRDEFAQTEAYSELFIELALNPTSATEFIEGVIPASLVQKSKSEDKVDLNNMSREELLEAFQKKIGPSPQ